MATDNSEGPSHPQGILHFIFRRDLPLEHETTAFILVNVLDFFMTYWLLWTGKFQEQNPIARYFLDNWGPVKGMLLFKLILVTTVCLISQIVATKQIRTARWLLNAGTVGVTLVVFYSLFLYLRHA